MDNKERDIDQFDAIAGDAKLSGDLGDIQDLDQWMKSLPLKEVGTNFTSTVIASAMLARKRHANFRLLLWMMGFFGLLIMASYLFIGTNATRMEFSYLDQFRDQSVEMLELISNPKLRQLFLIIEGIICLIVIEKLVSSFRILKHSV